MRTAIYARVSTKDQSCDLQLRDLRAYCTARGLAVAREYVDAGQSGAKDSRPELNELMSDARKRKIDLIIVWRFDRFARSTKLNWTPGLRQRVNPRFAIRCVGVERHWLFVAAWRWLVKRKRAMLESTPPGIASRKLIQMMSGARSHWVVPSSPWIDFPMPS